MSDSAISRVLVVGGVQGQFDLFLERVTKANSKAGPFDLVICVGDFFAPNSSIGSGWHADRLRLSAKLSELALHVYILGPNHADQLCWYRTGDNEPVTADDFESGFEITDGLTYLGRSGVLKVAGGLTVVYLSGSQGDGTSGATFDPSCVDRLVDRVNGAPVDILLTGSFPRAVLRHAELDHDESLQQLDQAGSLAVARLASSVRPRYHFCGHESLQADRLPYRNYRVLVEQPRPVTRFVCLAALGNAANRKHLYAFFVKPWAQTPTSELNEQPLTSTENPYVRLEEYVAQQSNQTARSSNFFFDTNGGRDAKSNTRNNVRSYQADGAVAMKRSYQERDPNDKTDKRARPIVSAPCWFCLASPEVDKQLIVSIGEHNYMALAKGGMTDEHMMLMPIAHCRNLIEIEGSTERDEVLDEHRLFKKALKDFWAQTNQVPVFFERNFKSQHAQTHAIAIPELSVSALVNCFERIATERRMRINEIPDGKELKDVIEPGIPYFYLEAADYRFFVRIRAGGDFPLQFGRELIAQPQVLNLPSKIDWRNCVQDAEDIKRSVQDIRQRFQPFDFTL
jgi:hypothetical protein